MSDAARASAHSASALPAGIEVRLARPADAAALRQVAVRAPIELGEATVVVDPGEDYFAPTRLMGPASVTYVVADHGRPVGAQTGVSYPVRLAGGDVEGELYLATRSRLLPEYAGRGVWSRLNAVVFEKALAASHDLLGAAAYIRPENTAAQRLNIAHSRWTVQPSRLLLDCRQLAGPGAGRPAQPDDAGHSVQVLNRCHQRQDLFVPYTAATLTERLARAPDLYTWSNVLVAPNAVVGVWRSGEVHTLRRADEATSSRRATVVDFGFVPGGEPEHEALLRAWCGVLADEGFTDLAIFSSPGSPGDARLRELATGVEDFDLCTPGLEEPVTAQVHGIYVDPVFF